jgi:hypothetical protein
MMLAFSTGAKPAGTWWVYTFGFSGGQYQPGVLLDYPQLGMDADAIIVSTNNFQFNGSSYTYVGSAVWAAAKQRTYNGLGLGFSAFGDAYSTAPAFAVGNPQNQYGKSYLLTADSGSGGFVDVWYMTNTSRPDSTQLFLEAQPTMAYAPPPRRVNQPGTGTTLDPLDGRFAWAPMQLNNFVWFAHGVACGTFPCVQYGAVSIGGGDATTTAIAFHSNSSDDFNPSLAITDAGSNAVYIWLQWAYTDTPVGQATSDTFNLVAPGGGVPNLLGTDSTLVIGSSTNEFRFGDYSSIAVDPRAVGTCAAGKNAVVAQQYFAADGTWHTRLAEVGFC